VGLAGDASPSAVRRGFQRFFRRLFVIRFLLLCFFLHEKENAMSVGFGGTVTAANGGFIVTDAKGNAQQVDLGTLMMMLNLDRTQNLDNQIALQLEDIQKRNDLIKALTDFLSQARSLKTGGKDDNTGGTANQLTLTVNGQTMTKYVGGTSSGEDSWAKYFGLDTGWADPTGNRPTDKDQAAAWDAKWDANIANIKSKIDTLNNESQMDNIKLQNLLEKRSNSFEEASKVMATNNESNASVIRNL
jgi:hypothetical protein